MYKIRGEQTTIEAYLGGFVRNAANIAGLGIRGDFGEGIAYNFEIFTSIPDHYAGRIYSKIDLPLAKKSKPF